MTLLTVSKITILIICSLAIISFSIGTAQGNLIFPDDSQYQPTIEYIKSFLEGNDLNQLDLFNGWNLYYYDMYELNEEKNALEIILAESENKELATINVALFSNEEELTQTQPKTINIINSEGEEIGHSIFSWELNKSFEEVSLVINDGQEEITKSIEIDFQEFPIIQEDLSNTIINPSQEVFDLLASQGYEFSKEEQDILIKNSKYVSLKKDSKIIKKINNEGKLEEQTIISLNLTAQDNVKEIYLIEIIPKEFAKSAYDITYANTPIVLEEDPVIMWHLHDENKEKKQTYSINKSSEVTGQSVILTGLYDVEQKSNVSWELIAPLLLIPLIGGFIIFFAKFAPKKE
jgi:hypothetical protein